LTPMVNGADEDEIVAAGGVVQSSSLTQNGLPDVISRDSPAASGYVLLVHRPKYDDWSFPKGKADAGESIEQTALREVREETGLDCRIIRPISSVRYTYKGKESISRPKVVHYFLMAPAGGRLEVNGYEIDRAEWFDTHEALLKLTYDHDRELLSEILDAGLV
jgi:8-oxo-dGTP pyrophosphatase MutT (NUDIX family)